MAAPTSRSQLPALVADPVVDPVAADPAPPVRSDSVSSVEADDRARDHSEGDEDPASDDGHGEARDLVVEARAVAQPASIESLRHQLQDVERRLADALNRAERTERSMNRVLAAEIGSMRDIVNSIDRDHADLVAVIRSDAHAEADRIVSEAIAFADGVGDRDRQP